MPASAARTALYGAASRLLETREGLERLADRAARFDAAGVFADGPWRDPSELQISLVAGTLRAKGLTPVIEALSELRLLAIAEGRSTWPDFTADDARSFLYEVMARNLGYLLPSGAGTEERRVTPAPLQASLERLFALLADRLGIEPVLGEVVDEVEQVLTQQPISVWRVRRMIRRAAKLADSLDIAPGSNPNRDRLEVYAQAITAPTPLSQQHRSRRDYRAAIERASPEELTGEAEGFAASMVETGLVCPAHAVLVRHLEREQPERLADALGLDEVGQVEIQQHLPFVRRIIQACVFPTTAQSIVGLRLALQRSLFGRTEVSAGLERLLEIEILPEVAEALTANRDDDDDVTAEAVLLAGTIAVLGQPLGIRQGLNPTCQSARGISLWAQHDPALLIKLVVAAARDGNVPVSYLGHSINSDLVVRGVADEIDLDLDPVSIALVPHLDRLYSELMRRTVLRLEDAHKWVNPALYGRWVSRELATAFADVAQTTVGDFDTFVRRFYATHHPEYNLGWPLMYPNPVGIVVTNARGRYLGPHAISILRIAEGPDGEHRVYFYNPNDEGRQDWGEGVMITVRDNGEEPGESSLPFEQFASRLYAFHYNPDEEGELTAVPAEAVARVRDAARRTWGRRFIWPEPLGAGALSVL